MTTIMMFTRKSSKEFGLTPVQKPNMSILYLWFWKVAWKFVAAWSTSNSESCIIKRLPPELRLQPWIAFLWRKKGGSVSVPHTKYTPFHTYIHELVETCQLRMAGGVHLWAFSLFDGTKQCIDVGLERPTTEIAHRADSFGHLNPSFGILGPLLSI